MPQVPRSRSLFTHRLRRSSLTVGITPDHRNAAFARGGARRLGLDEVMCQVPCKVGRSPPGCAGEPRKADFGAASQLSTLVECPAAVWESATLTLSSISSGLVFRTGRPALSGITWRLTPRSPVGSYDRSVSQAFVPPGVASSAGASTDGSSIGIILRSTRASTHRMIARLVVTEVPGHRAGRGRHHLR